MIEYRKNPVPRRGLRVGAGVALAASLATAAAQEPVEQASAAPSMPAGPTRVAVIDIDRIAQESTRGQALLGELQAAQDTILQGRQTREQEIRDLTNRAGSQLLSPEARADLTRDIERKNTDLQRWLEDQQRDFNEKQTVGFQTLEAELGPIVEEIAREQGIQLILRVTAGLTFIMDPTLDLSPAVIERFNAASGGESGQ